MGTARTSSIDANVQISQSVFSLEPGANRRLELGLFGGETGTLSYDVLPRDFARPGGGVI